MNHQEELWTGGQARSAEGGAGHSRIGATCRANESQANGRRVEARAAQVEENKAGDGYGGLHALVRLPGHHVQDGGQEDAYRKDVRCADRGDLTDARGAPCCSRVPAL